MKEKYYLNDKEVARVKDFFREYNLNDAVNKKEDK